MIRYLLSNRGFLRVMMQMHLHKHSGLLVKGGTLTIIEKKTCSNEIVDSYSSNSYYSMCKDLCGFYHKNSNYNYIIYHILWGS